MQSKKDEETYQVRQVPRETAWRPAESWPDTTVSAYLNERIFSAFVVI